MSEDVGLKVCPFCGGRESMDQFNPDTHNEWRMICLNEGCEAWGPERETEEAAIAAWNARVEPDGWLDAIEAAASLLEEYSRAHMKAVSDACEKGDLTGEWYFAGKREAAFALAMQIRRLTKP